MINIRRRDILFIIMLILFIVLEPVKFLALCALLAFIYWIRSL